MALGFERILGFKVPAISRDLGLKERGLDRFYLF